jgi:hypothetical protein
MRVRILDEFGDTSLVVNSKEDLLKEVDERKLQDRWFYLDGKFTPNINLEDFTSTQEVIVSEPLISG